MRARYFAGLLALMYAAGFLGYFFWSRISAPQKPANREVGLAESEAGERMKKVLGETFDQYVRRESDGVWIFRYTVDGSFLPREIPVPGSDGAATKWAVEANYVDASGAERKVAVAVAVRLKDGTLIDIGGLADKYTEDEMKARLEKYPRIFQYGPDVGYGYVRILTDLSRETLKAYGVGDDFMDKFVSSDGFRLYEAYLREMGDRVSKFLATGNGEGIPVLLGVGLGSVSLNVLEGGYEPAK